MWQKLRGRLKGWRTIVAAILTALIGLADAVGAIDLRPLIRIFVHGDEAQVGAVMTGLAVLFALLRLVTTTPIGGEK
jgi:hypothetical protein